MELSLMLSLLAVVHILNVVADKLASNCSLSILAESQTTLKKGAIYNGMDVVVWVIDALPWCMLEM